MTFKKETPRLVPSAIEPDVSALLNNGVMKIQTPTIKVSELRDADRTKLFQIWCHSPRVRDNSLGLCNHSMGAVIADISGEANVSMLWECPKCRTAYALTFHFSEKDKSAQLIDAKVVNLNREVSKFVDVSLDSEKDMWLQVH